MIKNNQIFEQLQPNQRIRLLELLSDKFVDYKQDKDARWDRYWEVEEKPQELYRLIVGKPTIEANNVPHGLTENELWELVKKLL
jgi:hypothetical protein